ncbi:hypothetical protein Scep_008688 [Stephania cephalantha]|uniref:Retrovirus-related Pol polyprotein from transposon TNT 1-94-like beta-barrel domain-containing protein n=1 Tax=Stephania cephalantha TaxID=152367 RepID=A0AAP0KC57_9MAGN
MTSNHCSSKTKSWIIDTGATNHISCKIDSMPDVSVSPYVSSVQIPNGDNVPVQAIGRVKTYTRGS